MKFALSILTAAFASTLAGAEYTVEIPKDAVWVTSWDEFHAEAPTFDQYLDEKYGGFVVEVNNKIVLATDEEMTKSLHDFFSKMEAKDGAEDEGDQTPKKRDGGLFALRRRKDTCSHAGCFNHSLCTTYTGCHYCLKYGSQIYKRGWCIRKVMGENGLERNSLNSIGPTAGLSNISELSASFVGPVIHKDQVN